MAKQKNTTSKRNGKHDQKLAAYFLSLSLENVRCFGPKQTLDLSDGHGKPAPWTIILGLNGTGKTTILQALAGFELLSPGESDFRCRLDKYTWGGEANYRRRGARNAFFHIETALSKNLAVQPIRSANYTRELCSDGTGPFQLDTYTPPWCCAYGASRRVSAGTLSTTESYDPTETLFSDIASLRNAEEWLIQLDYSAKSSPDRSEPKHRRDQVKQLLIAIMPEGEIKDIHLVAGTGPNPKARAEFRTRYGWVPLRQLGYGYQTLIAWMVDFASRLIERYPDSENPLGEPAVALVDEIDLHLHPTWQRKLMSVLTERFPNTQFIATAHSPLVAQAAAEANLAVLRREGDHVVIDNDVESYIRNWSIDQILTSDLFGLETARPPQIEPLLLERKELLSKAKLTLADKQRLQELEVQIGALPFGETAQERQERNEIRQTLQLLKEKRLAQ